MSKEFMENRLRNLQTAREEHPLAGDGLEDFLGYVESPHTIERFALVSKAGEWTYIKTYPSWQVVRQVISEHADNPDYSESPVRVIDLDTRMIFEIDIAFTH